MPIDVGAPLPLFFCMRALFLSLSLSSLYDCAHTYIYTNLYDKFIRNKWSLNTITYDNDIIACIYNNELPHFGMYEGTNIKTNTHTHVAIIYVKYCYRLLECVSLAENFYQKRYVIVCSFCIIVCGRPAELASCLLACMPVLLILSHNHHHHNSYNRFYDVSVYYNNIRERVYASTHCRCHRNIRSLASRHTRIHIYIHTCIQHSVATS